MQGGEYEKFIALMKKLGVHVEVLECKCKPVHYFLNVGDRGFHLPEKGFGHYGLTREESLEKMAAECLRAYYASPADMRNKWGVGEEIEDVLVDEDGNILELPVIVQLSAPVEAPEPEPVSTETVPAAKPTLLEEDTEFEKFDWMEDYTVYRSTAESAQTGWMKVLRVLRKSDDPAIDPDPIIRFTPNSAITEPTRLSVVLEASQSMQKFGRLCDALGIREKHWFALMYVAGEVRFRSYIGTTMIVGVCLMNPIWTDPVLLCAVQPLKTYAEHPSDWFKMINMTPPTVAVVLDQDYNVIPPVSIPEVTPTPVSTDSAPVSDPVVETSVLPAWPSVMIGPSAKNYLTSTDPLLPLFFRGVKIGTMYLSHALKTDPMMKKFELFCDKCGIRDRISIHLVRRQFRIALVLRMTGGHNRSAFIDDENAVATCVSKFLESYKNDPYAWLQVYDMLPVTFLLDENYNIIPLPAKPNPTEPAPVTESPAPEAAISASAKPVAPTSPAEPTPGLSKMWIDSVVIDENATKDIEKDPLVRIFGSDGTSRIILLSVALETNAMMKKMTLFSEKMGIRDKICFRMYRDYLVQLDLRMNDLTIVTSLFDEYGISLCASYLMRLYRKDPCAFMKKCGLNGPVPFLLDENYNIIDSHATDSDPTPKPVISSPEPAQVAIATPEPVPTLDPKTRPWKQFLIDVSGATEKDFNVAQTAVFMGQDVRTFFTDSVYMTMRTSTCKTEEQFIMECMIKIQKTAAQNRVNLHFISDRQFDHLDFVHQFMDSYWEKNCWLGAWSNSIGEFRALACTIQVQKNIQEAQNLE